MSLEEGKVKAKLCLYWAHQLDSSFSRVSAPAPEFVPSTVSQEHYLTVISLVRVRNATDEFLSEITLIITITKTSRQSLIEDNGSNGFVAFRAIYNTAKDLLIPTVIQSLTY